jgi:hypothetical protein
MSIWPFGAPVRQLMMSMVGLALVPGAVHAQLGASLTITGSSAGAPLLGVPITSLRNVVGGSLYTVELSETRVFETALSTEITGQYVDGDGIWGYQLYQYQAEKQYRQWIADWSTYSLSAAVSLTGAEAANYVSLDVQILPDPGVVYSGSLYMSGRVGEFTYPFSGVEVPLLPGLRVNGQPQVVCGGFTAGDCLSSRRWWWSQGLGTTAGSSSGGGVIAAALALDELGGEVVAPATPAVESFQIIVENADGGGLGWLTIDLQTAYTNERSQDVWVTDQSYQYYKNVYVGAVPEAQSWALALGGGAVMLMALGLRRRRD